MNKKKLLKKTQGEKKKRLQNKLTKSHKTNLKPVLKHSVNKSAIVRNIFKDLGPKKKSETIKSGLFAQNESEQLLNDLISKIQVI